MGDDLLDLLRPGLRETANQLKTGLSACLFVVLFQVHLDEGFLVGVELVEVFFGEGEVLEDEVFEEGLEVVFDVLLEEAVAEAVGDVVDHGLDEFVELALGDEHGEEAPDGLEEGVDVFLGEELGVAETKYLDNINSYFLHFYQSLCILTLIPHQHIINNPSPH